MPALGVSVTDETEQPLLQVVVTSNHRLVRVIQGLANIEKGLSSLLSFPSSTSKSVSIWLLSSSKENEELLTPRARADATPAATHDNSEAFNTTTESGSAYNVDNHHKQEKNSLITKRVPSRWRLRQCSGEDLIVAMHGQKPCDSAELA
jgi:hypothetical protein